MKTNTNSKYLIMRKFLLMVPGCLILISFMCCRNLSDKQGQPDQQGNLLARSRNIIDSLLHSRAILFDNGLQLERDSMTAAIAIYKKLSQATPGDFYTDEAKSRIHYWETRKFLETIRVASADSFGREKYFDQFPGYGIDSFLSYFLTRNFSIYNADTEGAKYVGVSYSMAELRKELTERKGPAFEVIAQMGYFYSLQYPTYYPNTGFPVYVEYGTNSYVAMVANCRLIFIFNDAGECKLKRIESYYLSD